VSINNINNNNNNNNNNLIRMQSVPFYDLVNVPYCSVISPRLPMPFIHFNMAITVKDSDQLRS